jgi:hypothetical protein
MHGIARYVAGTVLFPSEPRRPFGRAPMRPKEPVATAVGPRLWDLWNSPGIEPVVPQLRNYPR